MLSRRPLVVPLVCALASAALLFVAIDNMSAKRAELMTVYTVPQAQLFDLDPDELGAEIYSVGAARARDNLAAGVAAGKAARKAQQEKVMAQAIAREAEHARRMEDACNDNPSLPGCPYISQPITWNSVGVDPEIAGDHIYNMIANQARDSLDGNRRAEEMAVREANYRDDVARYEKEMAAAIRMKDGCESNPSLPGCSHGTYIIDVAPPAYAPEHDNTAYVYQNMERERYGALMDAKAKAKADLKRRNAEIAADMAAKMAAAEARVAAFRKACEEDPTNTAGCF